MNQISIRAEAKRCWRFLRRQKARPPETLCSGPFDVLPPELIEHIVGFLPTSSAAALALCNQRIRRALGGRHWDILRFDRSRQEERATFFQLLERDLPDHLFCDHCATLHLHYRPGEYMGQHECAMNDRLNGTSAYYHSYFQFPHMQTAMKLHRSGRDTDAYLAPLAPADTTLRHPHDVYLFEARIVADEFLVRAQHRLFVLGRKVPYESIDFNFKVCHHLRTYSYRKCASKFISMLDCKITHLNDKRNDGSCEGCTGLSQCDHCHTEFQIELKTFAGQGTAIVVTKWMNLGAGRSRSDPKWRFHLENHRASTAPDVTQLDGRARAAAVTARLLRIWREPCDPVAFEPRSIWAAFEQKPELASDSLVPSKNGSSPYWPAIVDSRDFIEEITGANGFWQQEGRKKPC